MNDIAIYSISSSLIVGKYVNKIIHLKVGKSFTCFLNKYSCFFIRFSGTS